MTPVLLRFCQERQQHVAVLLGYVVGSEQLNYHNPDVVAYVLAVRRQFMIRNYAAVRPPRRSTP